MTGLRIVSEGFGAFLECVVKFSELFEYFAIARRDIL